MLVGLISFLSGNALQDLIAIFIQKLSTRGLSIMEGNSSEIPGEKINNPLK